MVHFAIEVDDCVTPLCSEWSHEPSWTRIQNAVTCPECIARLTRYRDEGDPWPPTPEVPPFRRALDSEIMSPDLSPFARVVLRALQLRPGTPEELGRATYLPVGVVADSLDELRSAGQAEEVAPRTFRAMS